jgi:hypothetical protein
MTSALVMTRDIDGAIPYSTTSKTFLSSFGDAPGAAVYMHFNRHWLPIHLPISRSFILLSNKGCKKCFEARS